MYVNMKTQDESIILEAKRVILKEQLEKISSVALSNIKFTRFTSDKNNLDDNTSAKNKIKSNDNENDTPSDKENDCGYIITQLCDRRNVEIVHEVNFQQKDEFVFLYVKEKLLKKYFTSWKKFLKYKSKNVQQRDKLEEFINALKKHKKQQVFQGHQNSQKVTVISSNNKNTSKSRNSYFVKTTSVESPNVELKTYLAVRNVKTADPESFKNRYEAQKDIIEKQKMKLEEQERIIEALKLGKINNELQKSVESAKVNIREIFQGASTKTKCKLTPILTIGCSEKQFELELNSNKAPKVIQEMEKRAQDRALKRQIIIERKRLIDEEKKKAIEEAIEQKTVQDEEEKKRNLEAIKERRRKELELEKRKQINRQIYEQQLRLVETHYNYKLKKKHLKTWLTFVKNIHLTEIACDEIYRKKILKKLFGTLLDNLRTIEAKKYAIADKLYKNKLLKLMFDQWKFDNIRSKQCMQVAIDLYDMRLESKIFLHWHRYACVQYMINYKNMQKAEKHYKRRILFHYFYQWKSLQAVLQLEKAKEEKRQKWRQKVWEILPDYQPPLDF